jgi:hypothetical protein
MERDCRHYEGNGVKGFKVDFMDRDDQQLVDFITGRGDCPGTGSCSISTMYKYR